MLKNIIILKSILGVTQGHWKWYPSTDRVRVLLAFHCCCLYLVPFL